MVVVAAGLPKTLGAVVEIGGWAEKLALAVVVVDFGFPKLKDLKGLSTAAD